MTSGLEFPLEFLDAVPQEGSSFESKFFGRSRHFFFQSTDRAFHIINTVISIIREMTDSNDTVQVAAPSGSAAYNVKGCTLHSLLGINVQTPWKSLNEERKKDLRKKLKELLVLMVDERSMLNSNVTYGAEEHVRECAFNGHNFRERWGGVPVVLFFGDDYQLPPTDKNGAINGFDKYHNCKRPQTMTARSKNSQICEFAGQRLP